MKCAAVVCIAFVAVQTVLSLDDTVMSPPAWGVVSACVWLTYIVSRGWHTLSVWDRRQFLWGIVSAICFLYYLQYDPEFQVSHTCA